MANVKNTRTYEFDKVPKVVEYSEETTFHGMKYVFRAKQSIYERIFWLLILITLLFGLGYFVYVSVSRYVQFSLKIQENTQSTHVFEIPFPAITICPANKIQNVEISGDAVHDHFMKYINESANEVWFSDYGLQLIMATQVCRKSLSDFLPRMINVLSEMSLFDFAAPTELTDDMIMKLFEMSPRLRETVQDCQFSNWYDNKFAKTSNENVEQLFSEIITNEGLCYTFNTMSDVLRSGSNTRAPLYKITNFSRDGWDPETGYSKHIAYPFKGIVRGNDARNGLGLRLSANLSGRTEFCYPSNLGYKLLLHSPSAYPSTYEKFISLDYGKDYTIAVLPETISTPNTLRSISPKTRQCYFNDERELKYYTMYNENNCKLECYANYSLKMFGGFPFWAPRDLNIPASILKSQNYGWHLPNYFGSVHVYNEIYKNAVNLNSTLDTDCNCLPECNLIRYVYEIVDASVDMMESIRVRHSFSVSETSLEIIFQQPTFIGKQRIEEYTFSSLVSDFGGLLGLFMGGSIISIFELIYFLVIRNLCRTK